jgi:antitoxin component YwqK of YwqJK toxin-antitoxin module
MKPIKLLMLLSTINSYCFAQTFTITHSDSTFFQNSESFELKDDLQDGKYLVYLDEQKIFLDYQGAVISGKRSGKWVWYYPNGSIKRVIEYSNSHYDGDYKRYYSDSKLCLTGRFKNGLREGLWNSFHPNGQKKSEGRFTNGNPTGKWKYWDSEGVIILEEDWPE